MSTRDSDQHNPAAKDPQDWVTGDEPMTAAQESYLHTLAREAGEEVPDGLTKAEASDRIEELQQATGRGQPASAGAPPTSTRGHSPSTSTRGQSASTDGHSASTDGQSASTDGAGQNER